MKTFLVANLAFSLLPVLSVSPALANYHFVPADDSPLSRFCVTAVNPGINLRAAAEAAGIDPDEIDTIQCNGVSVTNLARKYGQYQSAAITAKAGAAAYVFNKSDEKPETQLCLAAVTSETEFRKLKDLHFGDSPNVESEVVCNGIPLKQFKLRYSDQEVALSKL